MGSEMCIRDRTLVMENNDVPPMLLGLVQGKDGSGALTRGRTVLKHFPLLEPHFDTLKTGSHSLSDPCAGESVGRSWSPH